jgi:hypothetical protein
MSSLRRLATGLSCALALTACHHESSLLGVNSAASAPGVLAFGDVLVGDSKVLSLKVTNDGSVPVDVTGATTSAPFQVAVTPSSIPVSGNVQLQVGFKPAGPQSVQGTLTISFATAEDITVQLTGNGTAVVPPGPDGCDDLTAPCGNGEKCCNHACTTVGPSGLCPCTGNGSTTFGKGSIIIPMDACWQPGYDILSAPAHCTANARGRGDDAPLKAYGLVYFLLQHQVTVYMAIDPLKAAIDDVDLKLVSHDAHAPVTGLDWGSGLDIPLTDNAQTTVEYRGAPFIIDASQNSRVMKLFAEDPDFAQFRNAGNIAVHVARSPFNTAVAKSISVVPSRVALLQVPPLRSGQETPTDILKRYLASAGLNFAGAGGTPAAPGKIYDVLNESDFLPDYASSKLKSGGYKLLWAPHWEGASTSAKNDQQLATIGAYVNAGGDLFAECAAIGTLEGIPGTFTSPGLPGSAATRFMSTDQLSINNNPSSNQAYGAAGPFTYSWLSSPFAQRGDFPFQSFFGAIFDFHPNGSAQYRAGVQKMIVSGGRTELFTSLDQHAQGKGTVVYLGGHDYSVDGGAKRGTGVTAGSRLVLNTLFSLGTNNVCQP